MESDEMIRNELQQQQQHMRQTFCEILQRPNVNRNDSNNLKIRLDLLPLLDSFLPNFVGIRYEFDLFFPSKCLLCSGENCVVCVCGCVGVCKSNNVCEIGGK